MNLHVNACMQDSVSPYLNALCTHVKGEGPMPYYSRHARKETLSKNGGRAAYF